MKLHVLINVKTDEIKAISEDKELILQYVIQNNFENEIKIIIVTGKVAEEFIILYEDVMLEEYGEYALTSIDSRVINNSIEEEMSYLIDSENNLDHIIKHFNFNKKEKEILKKALHLIQKSKKPKRFKRLLSIKDFIHHILFNNNITDLFKRKHNIESDKYYIHININDK